MSLTPFQYRCNFGLVAAGIIFIAAFAFPAPAHAAVQCKPSFFLRLAIPADETCVPAGSRTRTAAENVRAPLLWTPGAFGPKTCALGYVWREAFVGDLVCVTPAIRDEVRQENLLAPSRRL